MKRFLVFMTMMLVLIGIITMSLPAGAQQDDKPKIEIEGADSIWETGLSMSSELVDLAEKVPPRIVAQFVDIMSFGELTGSDDLKNLSKTVSPRIVVEYADNVSTIDLTGSDKISNVAKTVSPRIIMEYVDTCSINDLQGSGELIEAAKTVRPRIVVEYADSILTKDFSKFSMSAQRRILSVSSATGDPGSSANVQISISDATGLTSGDITMKYDSNVLSIGEVKGTDLISGISLIVNKNTPGIIKISMAGTKGLLSGSGALVDISLTINANAKSGTQISLELVDTALYDESSKAIPVSLVNGVVKVNQPTGGIKGDINNDGAVRSNDATLALRIAAGLMVPDEYQKWAADMNGDGVVRSNDATLILRKAAGLGAPNKNIIASAGKTTNVMLTEAYGVAGESIIVPISVDNIDKLASGDICITYDGSVLRAVGISSDRNLLLESNVSTPGVVRISFAGTDRLDSKTIAKIKFTVVADKVSPLSLQTAELYSTDAVLMSSRKVNGKFTSWAMPPANNALLQNFPNPFNPETWIPYQLKEAGEVKIRIYAASGELVRDLSLGYKPAGSYVSRDRSAYWDGRNEAGEKVASGLYFYTIQTVKYTATGKMLMLK